VGQHPERVGGLSAIGDTTVVAEMLDRLLHRSVVLKFDGDSYRLRDHHARNQNQRTAVPPGNRCSSGCVTIRRIGELDERRDRDP
jgi:IstB-like ATP binding protein